MPFIITGFRLPGLLGTFMVLLAASPAYCGHPGSADSRLIFIPTRLEAAAAGERSSPPAIPGTLLSGPSHAQREASIARYRKSIAEAETEHGPYHESISEDSLSLASLYRQRGEYQKAMDAYKRAFHVSRVNEGLYTLSQLAIVRGMIDTYLAMGKMKKAHEKQQYLYYLQRKNFPPDDPERVPAMIEWADWNVRAYMHERARHPYSTATGAAAFPSPYGFTSPRLIKARKVYHAVIELITATTGLSDPRLVSTERKLASLNYLAGEESKASSLDHAGRSGSYDFFADEDSWAGNRSRSIQFYNGSDALKRAIDYSHNGPDAENGGVAERMLELGDWYLLFDRRMEALKTYKDALAVLDRSAMSERDKERITAASGLPVQIPELERLAGSEPPPSRYRGYIDVAFTLNRFGKASGLEILDAWIPDSNIRTIKRALLRDMRRCKFRPVFAEGAPADRVPVRLRYYYAWRSQ